MKLYLNVLLTTGWNPIDPECAGILWCVQEEKDTLKHNKQIQAVYDKCIAEWLINYKWHTLC